MPPRNLKLVLEYDGSAYVGWERQKNGVGIQEVLEEAVLSICGERVVVEGSGRTDAGVHALGQVASFALEKDIHPNKLRLAINAVTPADIAVRTVEVVPAEFHARRSARSKLYRYTVLNARSPRPLLRFTSYHVPRALDVEVMAAAMTAFEGTHDFTAFAREADRKKSCVRTILEARLRVNDDCLDFEVEGTGFLYNMVRIIVGTVIEVGVGRRDAASINALLESGSRTRAGYTVPAHGLALVEVRY